MATPAETRLAAEVQALRKSLDEERAKNARLEEQLTLADAQVAETLERQASTAEILRVISSSPDDLQPVLDAVAERAAHLCEASDGSIFRVDGETLRLVAHHASLSARPMVGQFTLPLVRGTVAGRVVLERRVIHVRDLQKEVDEFPEGSAFARQFGHRTILVVPLLREGVSIGCIQIRRAEVQPFTEKQVELVQTFADQAVIAIENVRLFTELESRNRDLTEALEQQTATSEILRVISSSPTDLQPVLDTVVKSAARFCGADDAVLFRLDNGTLSLAAHYGPLRAPIGLLVPVVRGTVGGRSVLERRAIHAADVQAEAGEYPESSAFARDLGPRTILAAPLLREGEAIGTIQLRRLEVSPFTDKQIALLQTFADQAVIAIENVRLFTELEGKNLDLTQALGRQTATADVLRIIAQSPTELQPVLDAIATSAVRLCAASDAVIERLEGDHFYNAAHAGSQMKGLVGLPLPLTRQFPGGRAVLDRKRVIIDDMQLVAESEYPDTLELLRLNTVHSCAEIPLLSEGKPLGNLAVLRAEVRPFTASEIALLETFADQAVIAIENVRLFTELEARNRDLTEAHARVSETLEQQTATGEILRVISSSPTDLQPVLDAMAESATRLCASYDANIFRLDGDVLRLVAHHGPLGVPLGHVVSATRGTVTGRAVLDRQTVQAADLQAAVDEFPESSTTAQELGYRTTLGVPLLCEGKAIGAISLRRTEVQPFTDKQIALLQTFADQAVIAIENVRLFTELQSSNSELTTALDTQTATSDILRVISRSQTDVQPVFDAIVGSAVRLLGGYSGGVTRIAGDQLELAAYTSTDDAGDAATRALFPQPLRSEGAHAQVIRARMPLNVGDVQTDPRVPEALRAQARVRGYRSWVGVPLLRHDQAIGTISLTRREPGGFTDEEVALLATFADQAVIAIENVRLFKELQGKNQALTEAHAQVSEALERQTATSEILRVISRSQTDVQPVFDTIVQSAVRLCAGLFGALFQFDGELLHMVAHHNYTPEALEAAHGVYPARPSRDHGSVRAIVERAVVHIPDVELDPEHQHRELRRAIGQRSGLFVPMLREGDPIGVIMVARPEPGPFSNNEIELLKTFADQAVIAIENVRLFTELQASNSELTSALDTQTATSDILRAISRSQTDVQPVFDTIVTSAVRLLQAHSGLMSQVVGDQIELAALTSSDEAADAAVRASFPLSVHSDTASIQAIREPVNLIDIQNDPRMSETRRAIARARGYRSLAGVPLLRHDVPIGALFVTRREPGGFADDEMALLKTFADQAVIAIENARLLSELQARTEDLTRSVAELRALGEVGQAISSTLDLQTVLSAIVSRATQLSGTDAGVIYEYDEQREVFLPRATEHLEAEIVEMMLAAPVRKGEGATGQLAEIQAPIQLPNILEAPAESRVRSVLVRAGYRALLAVPLVHDEHLIGGLTVIRKATGSFASEIVDLLRTFATQSALAIQNARLFRQLEIKSRQLEVASQHKSEFLANISHELRTPLNAIIGYSEMLQEEAQDRQQEALIPDLEKINAAAKHQLGLINDILDLSKVEAGKMELELTDFHLPTAIDNALTLVRERAGRRGIALQATVDSRLGEVRADERKIKQVVLNLLSNAIKFTPEGGRIGVRAAPVDGSVEVSVSDTGVGIAPEDQDAVFEEFRQVGVSTAKQEGTGLGLTLCRKFVELHGGRIWVKSQTGVGSTFTFAIPSRRGE